MSSLTVNEQIETACNTRSRHSVNGSQPTVLANIYEEDTNIAIWQRKLSKELQINIEDFLNANPSMQRAITLKPIQMLSKLSNMLGSNQYSMLAENMAEIADMFSMLFELKRIGLRLTVLDKAMCPRFHVDRVPCRLVCTYYGNATEWLPHKFVDRTKLGKGSNGQPDIHSGLYQSDNQIKKLHCGDVALLKGELWPGNEKAGLVHRSPTLVNNTKRLLLTIDFSN